MHAQRTCDRTEFLGRNGTLNDPAAMHRTRLSGKVGAALDLCRAAGGGLTADGQQREIVFRLGAGSNAEAASADATASGTCGGERRSRPWSGTGAKP